MRNGWGTVGSISGGSQSIAIGTVQSAPAPPPPVSASDSLVPAIAPPEHPAALAPLPAPIPRHDKSSSGAGERLSRDSPPCAIRDGRLRRAGPGQGTRCAEDVRRPGGPGPAGKRLAPRPRARGGAGLSAAAGLSRQGGGQERSSNSPSFAPAIRAAISALV